MSRCSLLEKLYFQKFGTKRLPPLVGWWIPGGGDKALEGFGSGQKFCEKGGRLGGK